MGEYHERRGGWILAGLILLVMCLIGYGVWHFTKTPAGPEVPPSQGTSERTAAALCTVVVTDGTQFVSELTVAPGSAVGFVAACPVETWIVQLVVTDYEEVITVATLQFEGVAQPDSGPRSIHQWQFQTPEEITSEATFTLYPYADGQPTGDPVRLTMSPGR